jgi:hypothetical protein
MRLGEIIADERGGLKPWEEVVVWLPQLSPEGVKLVQDAYIKYWQEERGPEVDPRDLAEMVAMVRSYEPVPEKPSRFPQYELGVPTERPEASWLQKYWETKVAPGAEAFWKSLTLQGGYPYEKILELISRWGPEEKANILSTVASGEAAGTLPWMMAGLATGETTVPVIRAAAPWLGRTIPGMLGWGAAGAVEAPMLKERFGMSPEESIGWSMAFPAAVGFTRVGRGLARRLRAPAGALEEKVAGWVGRVGRRYKEMKTPPPEVKEAAMREGIRPPTAPSPREPVEIPSPWEIGRKRPVPPPRPPLRETPPPRRVTPPKLKEPTGVGTMETELRGELGIKPSPVPRLASTEEARRYGQHIKGDRAAIARLSRARDQAVREAEAAVARGDHNLAMQKATEAQLYREAAEFAGEPLGPPPGAPGRSMFKESPEELYMGTSHTIPKPTRTLNQLGGTGGKGHRPVAPKIPETKGETAPPKRRARRPATRPAPMEGIRQLAAKMPKGLREPFEQGNAAKVRKLLEELYYEWESLLSASERKTLQAALKAMETMKK